MANKLKVGYARVNATPPLGVNIAGYFVERIADGVLDELEVCAVAVGSGENTVILMTVDHCGLTKDYLDVWREEISKDTGVPAEAIYIHSTHTHQGPITAKSYKNPLNEEYAVLLGHRVHDAAVLALSDMKPAKMGIGTSEAKNVAFIRRYRMKDGSAKTNPGVNNPDIVAPIGITDESVHIVRFDREGAETVVIANFANHPDVVGGNKISADWPGLTRRFVEKAIDNTKCIFFNGAQGDVNHVNVHPKAGDFNDMFNDFDGCSRGYGHARHIGRVIAGAAMQVYDKVAWTEVDEILGKIETIEVPSHKPTPDELPLARKYTELHNAGRDEEIPFEGMALTTVVAEAKRMVSLENGPDSFSMPLSVLKIGRIAFVGFPGEPFTEIGRAVKETEGFELILPCCCANDARGYFPSSKAYSEGGYEARASRFAPGISELLVSKAKEMLK